MVRITFRPASWHGTGSVKAEGHAEHGPQGEDLVCAAVTALVEGFAANLDYIPGLQQTRRVGNGVEELRWYHQYHGGHNGVQEANSAAWHFYRALEALAKAYPEAVSVRWLKQEYYKAGKGRPKHDSV
jgi:uncharacterized protein YsxB (DUF464 family)